VLRRTAGTPVITALRRAAELSSFGLGDLISSGSTTPEPLVESAWCIRSYRIYPLGVDSDEKLVIYDRRERR
jgi:hypothetical protein